MSLVEGSFEHENLTTIYINIGLLASSAHTHPSFFVDPSTYVTVDTDTHASLLQSICVS